MEKIIQPKRQITALDEEQVKELIEETNGQVFYNKKQAFLYLLRYIFNQKYEEVEFRDSDQLFQLKFVKRGDE